MARIARVVVPGAPHHVTQCGNRGLDVFFNEEDRRAYLDLLREHGEEFGVRYWGYCLMPNHVHLIAVPKSAEGLAEAVGGAHQAYTRRINLREGWRGYLWHGRFLSCTLDAAHAERALCYVELNPVRARLVKRAEKWIWSSAAAHVNGEPDRWSALPPFLDDGRAWRQLLSRGMPEAEEQELRKYTQTGRPLGTARFVKRVEKTLGRMLQRKKPGPVPASAQRRQAARQKR